MRGWPLAAVLITVLVLVFATAAGLYASGPERVCEERVGPLRGTDRLGRSYGIVCERTNAYERVKGTITGDP